MVGILTSPRSASSVRDHEARPRNRLAPREWGASGGTDVTAISLWDNKANAEAYNTKAYPEVLKTLAKFIEGTPKVQTGEVVNSTFHKIAVGVGA